MSKIDDGTKDVLLRMVLILLVILFFTIAIYGISVNL